MSAYFVDNCNALVLGGECNDNLHTVAEFVDKHNNGPPMIVMDLPRTHGEQDFQSIESIKNGLFHSPKYKSKMIRMNRPHMLIFANHPPETRTMSVDRWRIIEIKETLDGSLYLDEESVE